MACGGSSRPKQDFEGWYRLDQSEPAVAASEKAPLKGDWQLRLEEKNNFSLEGGGRTRTGYWNLEKAEGEGYRLLLQGDGYTEQGRLEGKRIWFDQPGGLFDSLFARLQFSYSD